VRPANRPPLRRELEAMLVWLAEAPLRVGEPYLVKHLAAQAQATVRELAYRIDPDTLHRVPAATLQLNEIGRVSVDVFRPLPSDAYDRNRATGSFILIDPVSNATVGAGMIIDRARAEVAAADGVPPTAERRAARFGQRPATVWLTGADAPARARAVERRLGERGCAAVVLDDAALRGLPADGGAAVARLMNEAGLVVVAALAAPAPDAARAIVGAERFVAAAADDADAVLARLEGLGVIPRPA
jgi:bifunctional enzyme CysN/CysC